MALLASHLIQHLFSLADETVAQQTRKFFKTEPGAYSEGDCFIGIRVPTLRAELKKWRELSLDEAVKLLVVPQHEIRLFGLLWLVDQFQKGDVLRQKAIFDLYLQHVPYINNWDLVDTSAPYIVGAWLCDKEKNLLYQFARSDNLWQRRIAIVATFYFIRHQQFDDVCSIAEILLQDPHDLIHKAVGWMLREMGKRDQPRELQFLDQYAHLMPRTMLRYAIERLPEDLKRKYMAR